MTVHATSVQGPDDVVWLLEGQKFPGTVTSLALKLNLCDYRSGDSGSTTSVRFIEWLLDALSKYCPSLTRIILLEHDSSSTRAKDLFDLLGFTQLAADKGCELFNPGTASWRTVDMVGDLSVEVPKIVYEVDLLVNVPKIKFHGKSAYSGALKNNFGLLRRKWKLPYHSRLCEAIIASNLHLPRQFVLADGLITLSGRGPSYGVPVPSGIALASWDPVAADAAGAKLLGLPIALVGHLRMARDAGLGSNQPLIEWLNPEGALFQRPKFDWLRFSVANLLRRS